MNRTFLSLYLLIVIFVALMGWGLDKAWQYFSPAPMVTTAQQDLLTLIEKHLKEHDSISDLRKHISGRIILLSLDDFADSQFMDELASGMPHIIHNSQNEVQIYKRINGSTTIIRLSLPSQHQPQNNYVYEILLTVFYISIGLIVFIWVWPLMRDVKRLEQHTQYVGRNALPEPVTVMPGSAVNNLAQAFNRMAERIKELLASHKEMTYAVSHELRTPLARMKFALAMLQEQAETSADSSGKEENDHTTSLIKDVEEMDALITQLLSYAGYEHKNGPLNQESGDMAFLVNELIRRAKASHKSSDITVTLKTEKNAMQMQCEWHLMERAIFNLIHNGLRFASSHIIVELYANDAHYKITVEDDGPGIPPKEQERIFESFIRLDSEENAQTRGFGLGLAIVQRALKWHNGNASVSMSELGGAKFVLEWPKV